MISDAVLGQHSAAATPRWIDARDTFSLLALLLSFAAVVSMFAISPIALEAHGVAYIDAGGGFFCKFHPATPLASAAFVLRCLASRRPVHVAWHLATGDSGVLLLLASAVVAGIFAAGVDRTPVTPLVDTFLLPALVFVLLRDLDRRVATWLAATIAAVLIANAGLALMEYVRGFHFIQVAAPLDVSDDPTKANAVFSWKADLSLDWRAEALLGHPLVNGLVVGSLVICLAAPGATWIPLVPRACLFLLEAVSMFAFGARTALVLSAAFASWFVLRQVVGAIERGARLGARHAAPIVLALGAITIAAALLAYSGLADRTLDRFTNDAGSATTRLTMFALFDPISLADIVLHPDKDVVATLQRVYGLEFGIESSWIGLVLTYGAIVAAIVIAGILAFWRSVLRVAGRGAWVVFVFYMTLVSVTASLSGKTTTFAMVVALVVLFLRKDASATVKARASKEKRVHGPA